MKLSKWHALLAILFLFMLAGCEAAPESKELTVEEPKQQVVVEAVEESPTPPAEQAEQKKIAPTPEPEEPAEKSPKEDSPAEKKAAQVSADPVENQEEQQDQPQQEAKPDKAPPKEDKPSSEPTSPPQASTNVPTSRPAPVEDHKHSYKETVVAPTCEASGYTAYVCSCGDSYTDNSTEPLGHAYVQTGHADATTSAEGWTEYTCSRCEVSYRDTIPKIEQISVSAADAQRVCDEVNGYIRSHYAITQNRGTYMGITWVQSPSDVHGAINSTIGTVDLYAQYYGAKSFCCGYLDDGKSYTIVLYWDTI